MSLPLLLAILGAFSGIPLMQKDAPAFAHILYEFSFLKHAFDGIVLVLFGFDREKLECSDIYCHFEDPMKFLKFIELNNDLKRIITVLIINFIVTRFIVWLILKKKLKLR
jgi:hypothetical protein